MIQKLTKKEIQFRPVTDEGIRSMEQALIDFSWDFIDNIENVDTRVEAFQDNLFAIFSQCCPLKSRVISNNSEPYYTEKLRRLKRRKSREFTKHRKSHKYLSLLRLYKQELRRAKKSFYNLKIISLKTSNSKMWYSSLKKLLKYDKKEEVLSSIFLMKNKQRE